MVIAALGNATRSGRLQGRKALVADGDSGLGREVSIAFAREGADVAIGYRDDPDAAEVTGALARAAGAQVALLPGDLGDEWVCADVVERAVERLGGLDVLVVIERVMHSNLSTLRWLSGAAVTHLHAGSAIIATSLLAPSAIMTPSALRRMRSRGIRVRGIAPAVIAGRHKSLSEVYVRLAALPGGHSAES